MSSMINNPRGFTLLELLVVIVIMMALAAVAGVNISAGRDSVSLQTSARQLVSTLRSARVKAITEGRETGLNLSSENDDFYMILHNKVEVMLPSDISIIFIRAVRHALVSDSSVIFYPDGTSSGGELILRSPAGSMSVSIDWLTGKVMLDQKPRQ